MLERLLRSREDPKDRGCFQRSLSETGCTFLATPTPNYEWKTLNLISGNFSFSLEICGRPSSTVGMNFLFLLFPFSFFFFLTTFFRQIGGSPRVQIRPITLRNTYFVESFTGGRWLTNDSSWQKGKCLVSVGLKGRGKACRKALLWKLRPVRFYTRTRERDVPV